MSNRIEVDVPCCHCGSFEFMHVQGNQEELAGIECAECGRDFRPDAEQEPVRFDQLSQQDQEYIEYLQESN